MKRLKELESENARLKKIVAEQAVDIIHPKGGEPKKLLSPARRRAAVEHVRRHLGVSERRACKAIGQPRSTQRYVGRRKAEWDRRLVERTIGLSRENPRYGYRQGVGATQKGRVVGKQEARTPIVEGGGAEGARRKAAKAAAPRGRR